MCRIVNKKLIVFLCIFSMIAGGCSSIGLAKEQGFDSDFDNEYQGQANIFVSSAEMVFKGIVYENSEAVFTDVQTGEVKIYKYDGATVINDQNAQPLTIDMLQAGDVVNIAYNSEYEKVGAIVLSPSAFKIESVDKYSFNEKAGIFYVGEDAYSLTNGTQILSNGNNIELNQLISHDRLSIRGNGRQIYSITVDEGHGYLKLQNESALIGGWIEIGQAVISQLCEDMLFTVPEGTYQVRLTNTGIEEYRDVEIKRNEVTELNLVDIVSPVPEKGMVSFDIIPSNATVYVDGSYINTAYNVKLPIGYHEITVSAPGCSTVTEYFEVTGINQRVSVDLTDMINASASSMTVSGNSIDRNLYTNVIIEEPEDVEIYEDNIYKGVTPVSYEKTLGTHTITLYKRGYVTTSYNVTFEDNGEDEILRFPELEEESPTPTPTPSPTPTPTSSTTPTPTPTATPSATSTETATPTATPTVTPTPTTTPAGTATPSATVVPTAVPTVAPTATPADVPTQTPAPTDEPTNTPAETAEPTPASTPIPTESPAPSLVPTQTPEPTDPPATEPSD